MKTEWNFDIVLKWTIHFNSVQLSSVQFDLVKCLLLRGWFLCSTYSYVCIFPVLLKSHKVHLLVFERIYFWFATSLQLNCVYIYTLLALTSSACMMFFDAYTIISMNFVAYRKWPLCVEYTYVYIYYWLCQWLYMRTAAINFMHS